MTKSRGESLSFFYLLEEFFNTFCLVLARKKGCAGLVFPAFAIVHYSFECPAFRKKTKNGISILLPQVKNWLGCKVSITFPFLNGLICVKANRKGDIFSEITSSCPSG